MLPTALAWAAHELILPLAPMIVSAMISKWLADQEHEGLAAIVSGGTAIGTLLLWVIPKLSGLCDMAISIPGFAHEPPGPLVTKEGLEKGWNIFKNVFPYCHDQSSTTWQDFKDGFNFWCPASHFVRFLNGAFEAIGEVITK